VPHAIHHRLPIPAPGVERTGEFEGWAYILTERRHGQPLPTAWPHARWRNATGSPPSSFPLKNS
jgi:hypothetical protein